MRISQYHDYKRLKKYPLDIAFSEKEFIIDIVVCLSWGFGMGLS